MCVMRRILPGLVFALFVAFAVGEASAQDFTYLFSTFDNNRGLIFSTSNDGVQWTTMTSTYSYVDASNLRDPSWIKVGDTVYVAYTLAYPTVTNSFKIIKTKDFVNWSVVATPSIPQVAGGQAWAPEWFRDPSTGQFHIIVTGVNATWVPMKPYILDALSADFSSWSAPREITGSNFPSKVIDSWIEKQNGVYYLFYNNNDTGCLEVATSTSLDSGYTVIKSGNWNGWYVGSNGWQGPSLITLPDGRRRLYLDSYAPIGGRKLFYAESSSSDLATATWSALTAATGSTGFVGPYEHGTIREFIATRQIVVSASPVAGGIVNGGGAVDQGTTQTLTATPGSAYDFVNWTENGTEVSTAATYQFTVSGDRNLVANFALKPFYNWWSQYTATGLEDVNVSGPAATPRHDGTPNALKYLCGIDPTQPMDEAAKAALPRMGVETQGATSYLMLTFRQNPAATGLTVQVQSATDLSDWQTVTPGFWQNTGTDGATGYPIVKIGVAIGSSSRQFIRLKLTVP